MVKKAMAKKPYLAVVGGQTLLGREIRDLAAHSRFEVKALDTTDGEGKTLIPGENDEVEIMQPIDPQVIAGATAVILAADQQSAQRILKMNPRCLIDLGGYLENSPAAKLRAPMLEGKTADKPGRLSVVPHPAALMLGLFYRRLNAVETPLHSVANVFQPASELGPAALIELQQQSIALFNFQGLKKEIFDAQAAFAMLAQYGDDAPVKLATAEERLQRHLGALLEEQVQPSLRLLHAPVFHGLTASVWAEFGSGADLEKIGAGLAMEHLDVWGSELEAPSNVSMAGQDGVSVGGIRIDRRRPSMWFWLAADNHRLVAKNAMMIVEELEE